MDAHRSMHDGIDASKGNIQGRPVRRTPLGPFGALRGRAEIQDTHLVPGIDEAKQDETSDVARATEDQCPHFADHSSPTASRRKDLGHRIWMGGWKMNGTSGSADATIATIAIVIIEC